MRTHQRQPVAFRRVWRSSPWASCCALPTFFAAAAVRRRGDLRDDRRRARARRPAVPRRRRSQAAAHLPRLPGGLRGVRALRHARRARPGRPGGAADGGASVRDQRPPRRRRRRRRRPGGGRPVPDLLDDLARLRRAGGELRAVPAGAAGGRRLAAAARSRRARARRARGWRRHLAVGALIGTSALFKYQGLTFLGASIGMLGLVGDRSGARRWSWAATPAALPPGRRAGPARALPARGARAAGNAAAAIYWFKFNFSYVGAGLTGLAAVARGLRRTSLIGGVALVPYALGLGGGGRRGARPWRACSAAGCAGAASVGRRTRRRRRRCWACSGW